MNTVHSDSYQVSERVTLRPGDVFRASGGPYYKMPDGSTASMASKGPFRFIRHSVRGRRCWLEATDSRGSFCCLPLAKYKSSFDVPAFVPRPYRVLGKKRV